MITPDQTNQLLAKIDQEIALLGKLVQAAANSHPLREDDYITREQERESAQLIGETDRLNEFREAQESHAIDPDVVARFEKSMEWRTCNSTKPA